jgi:hypothetical protein
MQQRVYSDTEIAEHRRKYAVRIKAETTEEVWLKFAHDHEHLYRTLIYIFETYNPDGTRKKKKVLTNAEN